jgi:hypothetical protein
MTRINLRIVAENLDCLSGNRRNSHGTTQTTPDLAMAHLLPESVMLPGPTRLMLTEAMEANKTEEPMDVLKKFRGRVKIRQ